MADCAILAIASTTHTVRVLLQRLVKDVVLDEQASSMPWTIVNKYYTAEVKFLIHALSSWVPAQDELLAPAILFIWNKGESYRDQIRRLSQHTAPREFEVALAIRLSPAISVSPPEIEDDQDIDSYLSGEGFEFVDVPDVDGFSPDRMGIPGISRVVDALSTIMWSSMVRQTSTQGTAARRSSRGISSDDYHDLVRLIGEKASGNDSIRIQREIEELERWLDEDTLSSNANAQSVENEDEGIPWSTAVTPGTLSPSLSGFLENSRPTTPKAGFDDDFTSSISAMSSSSTGAPRPSPESLPSPPKVLPLVSTSFSSTFSFDPPWSGRSTPVFEDHMDFDATHLAPGESYKSLGSVSDFGEDRETDDRLSSGSDEDVPSRAEISETCKIFGNIPLSLSPTQGQHEGGSQTWATLDEGGPQSQLGEEVDVEMKDADLEHFDLESMLDTLRGLKEEIAGMPDKERRKAAARVALSLAYGVGGDPHP